jgi:hypothetical protein
MLPGPGPITGIFLQIQGYVADIWVMQGEMPGSDRSDAPGQAREGQNRAPVRHC